MFLINGKTIDAKRGLAKNVSRCQCEGESLYVDNMNI